MCNFKTVERKTLNRHQHSMHEKLGKLFPCDQCEYKTVRKDILVQHRQNIHAKDNRIVLSCDLCDFVTKESKTMNRHKKSAHKAMDQLIESNLCKYKTARKDTLVIYVHSKLFKGKL